MAIAEDTIREALKQVIDPELFVNIVDLGLIYLVTVEEVEDKSNIKIEMTMTSPAVPPARNSSLPRRRSWARSKAPAP
jgi:metal-sulfur cluster biosynthetic enzyme